jgi:hypothetical protein
MVRGSIVGVAVAVGIAKFMLFLEQPAGTGIDIETGFVLGVCLCVVAATLVWPDRHEPTPYSGAHKVPYRSR